LGTSCHKQVGKKMWPTRALLWLVSILDDIWDTIWPTFNKLEESNEEIVLEVEQPLLPLAYSSICVALANIKSYLK